MSDRSPEDGSPDFPAARGRILVIDDEADIRESLETLLDLENYAVELAPTGSEGIAKAEASHHDLILLDLMLPGRDGIQILTTIRKRGLETPVLLLTARDSIEDRVSGLNAGADDYLVKPFAFEELLARIRALLRRGRAVDVLRLGVADLDVDIVTRKVSRGGRGVDLTAREFELLEYLMRHEGQVVLRDMLARDVWKETARGTPLNNVIDVHIARLRRKVDVEPFQKLIHTVRGVGFMLKEGEP